MSRRDDFLIKYATPGSHYTLSSDPNAYLRSIAVQYSDLLMILTDETYSSNSKVLATCHPLADAHIWELASRLDIDKVNEALLSLEHLPTIILKRLVMNEDHYIRALAIKHPNATMDVWKLAKDDPHPRVQQALNTRL